MVNAYRLSQNIVKGCKSYDEKLKLIENIDPYNVSNFLFADSMELWPEIEFPGIANYLLFSTSSYTEEQLKAYKSLDAYEYFVAGWVRCIYRRKATLISRISSRFFFKFAGSFEKLQFCKRGNNRRMDAAFKTWFCQ